MPGSVRRHRRRSFSRLAVAVGAAVALAGCAADLRQSKVSLEVFRLKVNPRFNGQGVNPDPLADGDEWFEQRSGTLLWYHLRLPSGLRFGAGLGNAEYVLGTQDLHGGENGVLDWRAELSYRGGSRTFFDVGARYEAVEDTHLTGYQPSPDEIRYETRSWRAHAEAGRLVRGLVVSVGVAHAVSESSYLGHLVGTIVDEDFGMESAMTFAYLAFETPDDEGVTGRLEAGLSLDDIENSYSFSASMGIRF